MIFRHSPESTLWTACLAQALEDLSHPDLKIKDSALNFFKSDWLDKVIALLPGINQDVIPMIRQQALLLYSQPPRNRAQSILLHSIMSNDSDELESDCDE